MRIARKWSLSTAFMVIVACAGSVAWEDNCGCAPQWTVLTLDLEFTRSTATCTFWFWHKDGQERGLQLELHESPEAHNLAADGVKARYVFRDPV